MKKFIAFILLLALCISCVACGTGGNETATTASTTTASESETDTKATESTTANVVETSESSAETTVGTAETSDSKTESSETVTESSETVTESSETVTENTGSETSETTLETSETETETTEIELEGPYGDVVENANAMANGVQTAYNSDRTSYTINNTNMSLDYNLVGKESQMVSAIKNKAGASYVENTMDVFVKMKDGSVYYASESSEQTRVNIYRIGYYYYDVRFLEQTFNTPVIEKETEVPLDSFKEQKDATKPTVTEDGYLYAKSLSAEDPHIISDYTFKAEDYNCLQIEISADISGTFVLYLISGGKTFHTPEQSVQFNVTSGAGTGFVTVNIDLTAIPGYSGDTTGLRIDFPTINDYAVKINSVKLIKTSGVSGPQLALDRTFHTYSDKLHQELHIVAKEDTADIDCFGIVTEIDASKVASIFAYEDGVKKNLEDIDMSKLKFIGFDIIDVGIFGYIMPGDGKSGSIDVVLEDGKYIITQTASPANGTVKAPQGSTANDFSFGHRIYTDSTHSFADFFDAAYCEINPIPKENIIINREISPASNYVGYDYLRGAYHFTITGTGSFNDPYYTYPNRHFYTCFSIKGVDYDRNIYVYTSTTSGCLECAVVLGNNDILLPIPTEVIKNFSENEEPVFRAGDASFGETIFPLFVSKKGDALNYTVANLYQNWGNYPLKQLSAIPYYTPYYHLSTGVTESNCISPWYNRNGKDLYTLPDFRPMSMPASSDLKNMYKQYGNQPQRPNTGVHRFIQYTNAAGELITSEYIDNFITSAGPVYADVTMNYLTDDGNIAISYRHMEFPQTDENRTYYEVTYEVLGDVTIEDFCRNFVFYTGSTYYSFQKVGYLDKNGECKIVNANNNSKKAVYTLGKESPYISYFLDPGANEYANQAILVYNSDITIGGEKFDGNFAAVNYDNTIGLTLDIRDDVTLKTGDVMKLNLVLLPWGGSWIQDDGTRFEYTDDALVRAVRENTLLDPLKVEASVGSVIESVYLPEVKAENNVAEFTLSGGENNVAVRVYNFTYLTVPKIFEKNEAGEWVEYEVSSANNPDKNRFAHEYDGYYVYYDGDGTYSYAFIVAMTDKARTFKVVCEEYDFDYVPPVEEVVYIDPENDRGYVESEVPYCAFIDMINAEGEFGAATYSYRGGNSYRGIDTFYFNRETFKDGSLVFTGWTVVEGGFEKFVWSADNGKTWHDAGFRNMNAFGNGGQAHLDASSQQLNGYKFVDANSAKGAVYQSAVGSGDKVAGVAAYLGELYEGQTVNVVYAAVPKSDPNGLCLIAYVKGVEVTVVGDSGENEPPKIPEASDIEFIKAIDYIYIGDHQIFNPVGGFGGGLFVCDASDVAEPTVTVKWMGWAGVNDGFSKWVFSTDGGETWNDIVGGYSNITGANIKAEIEKQGFTNATENGSLSLVADLSYLTEVRADVIFGAVPNSNKDAVIPMVMITNIRLPVECTHPGVESWEAVAGQLKEVGKCAKCGEMLERDVNFVVCLDKTTYNGGEVGWIANSVGKPMVQSKMPEYGIIDGKGITLQGWVGLNSGVSTYKWSIDGETWYDAGAGYYSNYNIEPVIRGFNLGIESFTEGCQFNVSLSGLCDLDAGTYTVYLGAVPKNNPDVVVTIVQVNNVIVP